MSSGDRTTGRIRLVLAAVVVLAAVEIAGGALSGSLALLSDAGHLITDTGTLALTWFAVSRARRPAGARHTYGHHRLGIVAAAVNGVVLLAVAVAIAAGAVVRLQHPATVRAIPVVAIAAVALVTNAGLALLLFEGGGGLGVRTAALHVAADACADAAVVVGAIAVLALGWQQADAVASLVIAVLVLLGAVGVLRESTQILVEATPPDIDADRVHHHIASFPGVVDVHDLHIWSLDREHRALSVHVTVRDCPLAEVTRMIRSLETSLCTGFDIGHATVQPECPSCLDAAPLYCDPAARHERIHQPEANGGEVGVSRGG